MVRGSDLGAYVHVGVLRGGRFTVTAISDQVCVNAERHGTGRVHDGACTLADRRASMTPLQDSANLLLLAARDSFRHTSRVEALRELLEMPGISWVAQLIAPHQVQVSGLVDRDRNGLDDDGRVGFHAGGRSVCATLPIRAEGTGTVTFGTCDALSPRPVNLPPESPTRVFREIKGIADFGASMAVGAPIRQARKAAHWVNMMAFRPGQRARAIGDRVQLRARINGQISFACYRVSPEGHPAVYATTGMPGTWRLGRCA